jgi:SAM-dependent methyltransferase
MRRWFSNGRGDIQSNHLGWIIGGSLLLVLGAVVQSKSKGSAEMDGLERIRRNVRLALSKSKHATKYARRLRRSLPGGERINFGDLERTTPVSSWFGFDRGRPVDRKYIEDFLRSHSGDIRGRVLEVGDNAYTRQFGGSRVLNSEVLHIDPDAPDVTYVADLADGTGLPDEAFDCVVLTQTLHLIYDFSAALRTLHRILKPGGALLLTVPGVSSVDNGQWGGTWYWSFTQAAMGRMLEPIFGRENIEIETHGNVLVATAFLYGLADHEIEQKDFAVTDPAYPVIVAARVRKA